MAAAQQAQKHQIQCPHPLTLHTVVDVVAMRAAGQALVQQTASDGDGQMSQPGNWTEMVVLWVVALLPSCCCSMGTHSM